MLLIGSIVLPYTTSYEPFMDLVICLGAILLAVSAVRSDEYFQAAGFAAVTVFSSPIVLVMKILLLLALSCAAILGALLVAFGIEIKRRHHTFHSEPF